MNWKRNIWLFLTVTMLYCIVASCAGDPRKNCNHPQHGAYMMEQRKKKTGF
jgi:hypothetical protein